MSTDNSRHSSQQEGGTASLPPNSHWTSFFFRLVEQNLLLSSIGFIFFIFDTGEQMLPACHQPEILAADYTVNLCKPLVWRGGFTVNSDCACALGEKEKRKKKQREREGHARQEPPGNP